MIYTPSPYDNKVEANILNLENEWGMAKKKARVKAKPKRAAPKPKEPSLIDTVFEQIRTVESKLQDSMKQLETKAAEFLDRVEFESRVSELQSRIFESIPRMEAELKSMETRLARAIQKPELESRLAEVEKRLNSLTTEIEALKGRVKDLEAPEV